MYLTQLYIVRTMMVLEDAYTGVCRAGGGGDRCLVVCDRGLLDASVYCDRVFIWIDR